MQANKQNLAKAYKQFEVALDCAEYPGSDRQAPEAHVQTSMAATVLQMIKYGDQDKESGQRLIQNHIEQASSGRYFDAHTFHVSASLFYELSMQGDSDDEVSFDSLSKSLSIIESTLQKIGSPSRSKYKFSKAVMLLTKLRTEVLESHEDLDELKVIASNLFEKTGSTAGYEVASRMELAAATENNKGKKFNKLSLYIDECEEIIKKVNGDAQALIELKATRIDLVVRWQLQKPSGQINWGKFHSDTLAVVHSEKYKSDPLKIFYLAISHFHLDEIPTANALFSQLRANKSPGLDYSAVRHWHVGKEGSPKRNQCMLKKNQGRTYAVFSELSLDIPVYGKTPQGGTGITTHAYIGFSLNGLTAVFDGPDHAGLLLP